MLCCYIFRLLLNMAMSRSDEILAGLAEQREEGMLCDVKLKAEGQTISAHKNVLVAGSPYFKAMFSGR